MVKHNYGVPRTPPETELRMGTDSKIPLNGGLSLKYQESALTDMQSPKIENMNADDRGSLIKRWGLTYLFATSLGATPINGVYDGVYKGNLMLHWGTSLYTQAGSSQPVLIYTGLANAKSFFFVFNSILYIMDGTNYIQFDGTTVKAVVPYIPTISITRKPDGTQSTVNESWNMLGNGFTDSFNGDNITKIYQLSLKGLDANTVTSNVGGTEGAGFTVDRTNGIVTFTTAPIVGIDSVKITAYKTQAGLALQIQNCTFAMECYGVMFVSGNPNMVNYYWASGVTLQIDASYFPQKRFYTLKGADKKITGFALHFGQLVIFKEDLIARVSAITDLSNNTSFAIDFVNNTIGCDMPYTIRTSMNDIVFCNTYGGVYILQKSLNLYTNDKTALPISGNINGIDLRPGLLQENITDLQNASSYVYHYKYYLCVGTHAYVWDFDISYYSASNTGQTQYDLTWWYYTNVNAKQFFNINNILYFTDRNVGLISLFANRLNDYGLPINASWRSKLMDFQHPDWEKTVSYIWLTTRAGSGSAININYFDENESLINNTVIPANVTKSFSFSNFSFSNFTFGVQRFAPTIKDMPKLKKIVYFQIEITNSNFNENLSLISLVIKYILNKKVR